MLHNNSSEQRSMQSPRSIIPPMLIAVFVQMILLCTTLTGCSFETDNTNYDSLKCEHCSIPLSLKEALELDSNPKFSVKKTTEEIDLLEERRKQREAKKSQSSSTYVGGCHSHPICVLALVPLTFSLSIDALYAVGNATVSLKRTLHTVTIEKEGIKATTAIYTKDGQLMSAQVYEDDEIQTYLRQEIPCTKDAAAIRITARNKADGTVVEIFEPADFQIKHLRKILSSNPDEQTTACLVKNWYYHLNQGGLSPREEGIKELVTKIGSYPQKVHESAVLTASRQAKERWSWVSDNIGPQDLADELLRAYAPSLSYESSMEVLSLKGDLHAPNTPQWASELLSIQIKAQCDSTNDVAPLVNVMIGERIRKGPVQDLSAKYESTCNNPELKKILGYIAIPQTGNQNTDLWLKKAYEDGLDKAVSKLRANRQFKLLLSLSQLDEPQLTARAIHSLFLSDFTPKEPDEHNAILNSLFKNNRHPADVAKLIYILRRTPPSQVSSLKTALQSVSQSSLSTDQKLYLEGILALFGEQQSIPKLYSGVKKSVTGWKNPLMCEREKLTLLSNDLSKIKNMGDSLIQSSTKAPWEWRPKAKHTLLSPYSVFYQTHCSWIDEETQKPKQSLEAFIKNKYLLWEIFTPKDTHAWILTQFGCGGQIGETCLEKPLPIF
ncbi:MAG: hypothetical protein CMK59_09820 [Proteobacteria bacterium]|nr:hypothetical protein [Pseudomonadota bacterium]